MGDLYNCLGEATSDNGHEKCAVFSYGQLDSKDCAVEYPFICKMPARAYTLAPTIYPPTPPTVTTPCDPGMTKGSRK